MFDEIEDTAEVFVRDAAGDQDLAAEPLQSARFSQHGRAQGLKSEPDLQLLVTGFVDFAHSPGCNEAQNAKTSCDQFATIERRGHPDSDPPRCFDHALMI